MDTLIAGLRKFVTTVHAQDRELYRSLADGQQPAAFIIACSDSRVNPSAITQAAPGTLFIARNAGNILPTRGNGGGEAATLQYAVEVLKVQDVIICGHSDCGAVKALLNGGVPALAEVHKWIGHSSRVIELMKQYPDQDPARRLRYAVECNVLVQLDHLQSYDFVQDAVAEGRLNLHGWYFDIPTGEVFGWNPDAGAFTPIVTDDRTDIHFMLPSAIECGHEHSPDCGHDQLSPGDVHGR